VWVCEKRQKEVTKQLWVILSRGLYLFGAYHCANESDSLPLLLGSYFPHLQTQMDAREGSEGFHMGLALKISRSVS
jgi:hypothetical protein